MSKPIDPKDYGLTDEPATVYANARVYDGITFSIHGAGGEVGSVTVAAPRRFYRRWAMGVAAWLWQWAARP